MKELIFVLNTTERFQMFSSHLDVKQGEPFSPILFLPFVHDVETNLTLDDCDETSFMDIKGAMLYVLPFADDTVIFAKNANTLQKLLDKFMIYCNIWNLEINVDKSKVVVFRKGKHQITGEWFVNGEMLELLIHMYI